MPPAAATPASRAGHAPLGERIQKVLADLGLGSRRQIDRWVIAGRVTIDGRKAQPGDQVTGRERVCVDGRPVKRSAGRNVVQPSFAAFYKPSGLSLTIDRDAEKPVKRALPAPPKHGRWIPLAALDTSAAGLVVLTTDGALVNRLARRGSGIDQEFAVRLLGQPGAAQVERMSEPVELDEGTVQAESVTARGGGGANVWYHVVLREAGSRELRGILDAAGVSVSRIIRVRYGPVQLGTLRRGASRALSAAEVEALRRIPGPDRSQKVSSRSPR